MDFQSSISRQRSEVGHRAISDLISHCSDSEGRGNTAILARGAGKPAFVRQKITTPGEGELLKMLRKVISGGQTGADRAGLDFAIETDLEHGGYVPRAGRQRTGESMTDTTCSNSQPPLILREPGGTSRKATVL
jgi:Circularly permutated YpsA SLOG family